MFRQLRWSFSLGTYRSPETAFLLSFLLVAATLSAAEPTCMERTLPVTVKSKDNKLAKGLTTHDFRAEFQGQPMKVLSVEHDSGPRRIVVILDVSGSAAAPSPYAMARRSTEEMAYFLGTGNQVALLTCGEQIEHRIGFSDDREVIARWLAAASQTDAFGGSCGAWASNAVREALRLLEAPQVGDSLFVVSDGVVKPTGLTQAEELLLSAGVRVFVLLLRRTGADFLPDTTGVYPNGFLGMAENTGGLAIIPTWYVVMRQDQELTREQEKQQEAALSYGVRLYGQLHTEMVEFYRLQVEVPQALDKAHEWKLEVVDENGRKRKGLIVTYPQRLFPCEQESGISPAP